LSIASIKDSLRAYFVPRKKLLIFNYHQVSETFDPSKHIKGIWTQMDYFKEQINYLKINYDIVRLSDGLVDLNANGLKSTKVVLTFDDGDKSILDGVIPFLESENIPASFFINSAYFDSNEACWTDTPLYLSVLEDSSTLLDKTVFLRNTTSKEQYSAEASFLENNINSLVERYNRYLDMSSLKKLNQELFTIGLHGHEHQRFCHYDYEWQLSNLQKNIDAISGLNNYIPVFAIPFGKKLDWDKNTLKACRELNLTPLYANGGYNTCANPIGHRIPADARDVKTIIKHLSPFISNYN